MRMGFISRAVLSLEFFFRSIVTPTPPQKREREIEYLHQVSSFCLPRLLFLQEYTASAFYLAFSGRIVLFFAMVIGEHLDQLLTIHKGCFRQECPLMLGIVFIYFLKSKPFYSVCHVGFCVCSVDWGWGGWGDGESLGHAIELQTNKISFHAWSTETKKLQTNTINHRRLSANWSWHSPRPIKIKI